MGKDLTEEQVASMREVFTLFDTDGDGRITVSELGILIRLLGGNPTQAQLKEITAAEGLTAPFDFPRFMELMRKHLRPEPFDRQLRDAFGVLDKDSTGFVVVSDLRHILTSIGKKLDPMEFDEDFILRMVAKCVSTLLNEMKCRGKDYQFGVISMCIGLSLSLFLSLLHVHKLIELAALKNVASFGMGAAAIFERGDVVDQLSNARRTPPGWELLLFLASSLLTIIVVFTICKQGKNMDISFVFLYIYFSCYHCHIL